MSLAWQCRQFRNACMTSPAVWDLAIDCCRLFGCFSNVHLKQMHFWYCQQWWNLVVVVLWNSNNGNIGNPNGNCGPRTAGEGVAPPSENFEIVYTKSCNLVHFCPENGLKCRLQCVHKHFNNENTIMTKYHRNCLCVHKVTVRHRTWLACWLQSLRSHHYRVCTTRQMVTTSFPGPVRLKFSKSAVAAPWAWKRLPTELKLMCSTPVFKRSLKTFLFQTAYCS